MSRKPAAQLAVTGVGAVCGWGWGADTFWSGVCSGATCIGPFSRFANDAYPTHIAGEVSGPEPPPAGSRGLPFADRFAVWSAVEAVRQAGLPSDLSGLQAGVFFGSSAGGMFEAEEYYFALDSRPLGRVSARALATQHVASPGEAVSRRLRVGGPAVTVSSACASATLAIESGMQALLDGSVDIAIVGGADSLCQTTYAGFNSLQSVDERPSRPFRSERRGLSLGEGGAVLILERTGHGQRRGMRPLAELVGAGCTADAHHMTAPHPEGKGAALALRRALDDAEIGPDDVDFVNAHGTGTALNDRAEYHALCEVFGERAHRIPIICTKGSVGHLLGSAGAIEAVATVLSLHEQTLPPTPGTGAIDPATPLRVDREHSVAGVDLEVGVTLNLAFGGCNGALVFRRWNRT